MGFSCFWLKEKKNLSYFSSTWKSSEGEGCSFFLSRQKLKWRTFIEVKMTAQAPWNELIHHHCLILFSLFLLCLSLSLKMTALMTTSWEPLQSNLKQDIITVGLKAPSLQSNSSCMSSGSSNKDDSSASSSNLFCKLTHWITTQFTWALQDLGPSCAWGTAAFLQGQGAGSQCYQNKQCKAQDGPWQGVQGAVRRLSTDKGKPGVRTISSKGELAQSPTLLRGSSGSRELCQTFTMVQVNIQIQKSFFMCITNTANYTVCLIAAFWISSVCDTQSIRKQQPSATTSLIRLQFPAGVWSSSLDSFLYGNGRSMNYWRCALKWCW